MKRLKSVETDKVQLEVGECDCGYHFGVDATYLEQVGDFIFKCPVCNTEIPTAVLFPDDPQQEPGEACRRCGHEECDHQGRRPKRPGPPYGCGLSRSPRGLHRPAK